MFVPLYFCLTPCVCVGVWFRCDLLLCLRIGRDAVERRVVSSGDALVTLVADTTQVVLLVLSCRRFDEPFFQIGVRPPAVVLFVVACQAVGWRRWRSALLTVWLWLVIPVALTQVLPSLVTSLLSVWFACIQFGSACLCESSKPMSDSLAGERSEALLSVVTTSGDDADSRQSSHDNLYEMRRPGEAVRVGSHDSSIN